MEAARRAATTDGCTTFKMLAEKGKKLYSPITAYSTHAEEKWMSYFIDWRKESLC